MKFCHSQVNGWNWRILSEIIQTQKAKKPHILPPMQIADKCSNIMDHTNRRLCKAGIGQGKETKNLDEVDVLTLQE
jgi:hypothetical protein